MHNERELKQFDRWGKGRPSHEPHGTEEEIRKNLAPLTPTNWRLEGNKLIADTALGRLVHFIPTNYILTGLDAKGLPEFRKLDTE